MKGPEVVTKKIIKENHAGEWNKADHDVLRSRYESVPHQPPAMMKSNLSHISHPLKGKYASDAAYEKKVGFPLGGGDVDGQEHEEDDDNMSLNSLDNTNGNGGSLYSSSSIVSSIAYDDDDYSLGGDSCVSRVSVASRMRYRNMIQKERGARKNAVRAAREHLINVNSSSSSSSKPKPSSSSSSVGQTRDRNQQQQKQGQGQEQEQQKQEQELLDLANIMKRLSRQPKDMSHFDNFHGEYKDLVGPHRRKLRSIAKEESRVTRNFLKMKTTTTETDYYDDDEEEDSLPSPKSPTSISGESNRPNRPNSKSNKLSERGRSPKSPHSPSQSPGKSKSKSRVRSLSPDNLSISTVESRVRGSAIERGAHARHTKEAQKKNAKQVTKGPFLPHIVEDQLGAPLYVNSLICMGYV